jgi:hypothetical protein
MGIPPPAIKAELRRRRLPPELLDCDPQHELPADLRMQPVIVEFTEVYAPEFETIISFLPPIPK